MGLLTRVLRYGRIIKKKECTIGLDQFAYSLDKSGEKTEIAYWRKHPNLQGWMSDLWEEKGKPGLSEVLADGDGMGGVKISDFNCIPLELTREDIKELEDAILNNTMPQTVGFFFGDDSDDYYREQDLAFINKARLALDSGDKVYYDSWW